MIRPGYKITECNRCIVTYEQRSIMMKLRSHLTFHRGVHLNLQMLRSHLIRKDRSLFQIITQINLPVVMPETEATSFVGIVSNRRSTSSMEARIIASSVPTSTNLAFGSCSACARISIATNVGFAV